MEDLVSRTKMAYERVSSFLRGLGISINGGKSQWMMVRMRQRLSKVPQDPSVTLDGVMILRKSTVTVLGVTIDEVLLFTTHMESVCSKAAGRLRLLFRTARRLPTRYRASLAKALIYSPLIHCDTAMCNINKRWLNRLDEIQRGAARLHPLVSHLSTGDQVFHAALLDYESDVICILLADGVNIFKSPLNVP